MIFGPKILLILYDWTAVVIVYVHGMTSKFALGDIYIYIYIYVYIISYKSTIAATIRTLEQKPKLLKSCIKIVSLL